VLRPLAVRVLSGCATLSQPEGLAAERLLAAAGFQVRAADTPEGLAHLKERPARRVMAHIHDGEPRYTYADPGRCRCLYVGGAREYAEYRRLAQQEAAIQLDSSSRSWLWVP
jgi:hypothetical protein